MPEFLSAVTGWNVTLDDCLALGERIGTIRHAFNLREGLNPLEWEVPSIILGRPPLKQGNLRGVTVDAEAITKDYLDAMDWDLATTRPTQAKLHQLGLEDVAEDLYG